MPTRLPLVNEAVSFKPMQWQLPTPPSSPEANKTLPVSPQTPTLARTSRSWLLPSSFLTSLSSPGSFVVDGSADTALTPNQSPVLNHQSPKDLRTPAPTDEQLQKSQPPLQTPKALPLPDLRGRSTTRRCVSADTASKARAHFTSPDRFVTPRSFPFSQESPYKSSKSPHTLTPHEKHTRERDHSHDPFRPHSESRSRQVIRQVSGARHHSIPHFVPHFVQDNEPAEVVGDHNGDIVAPRQVSAGAVWNVGGALPAYNGPLPAIDDGRGGLIGGGTNAPLHVAHFLDRETHGQDIARHRSRLSLALDIDEARRILRHHAPSPQTDLSLNAQGSPFSPVLWRNGIWMREGVTRVSNRSSHKARRAVPATPFRVLDAPRLRDDFYCSTLAYSETSRSLAVGLSARVYLWSEEAGVQFPPFANPTPNHYVTSLSFSSTEGGKSILAVGRQDGQVSLWSTFESDIRFEAQQPNPVSCLSFSPYTTSRPSEFFPDQQVPCEDLLVGDDTGNIYYYSIEWPDESTQRIYPHWTGAMRVLAKVNAHSQQICGLAWSPDRKHFATGGNDNVALLFKVSKVLANYTQPTSVSLEQQLDYENIFPIITAPPSSPRRRSSLSRLLERPRRRLSRGRSPPPQPRQPQARFISASETTQPGIFLPDLPITPLQPAPPITRTFLYSDDRHYFGPTVTYSALVPAQGLNTAQTHTFRHAAAVKALAFPVWQPSLLATGGGSNDRAIHFFHTGSGATLATISVHAQVTALIWSKTRREVCATFGYAQPEHGIRIAVFAWPSGECVVSIPWGNGENGATGGRALWAIAYPGGPNDGSTSSGPMRGRTRRRANGERGVGRRSGDERIGNAALGQGEDITGSPGFRTAVDGAARGGTTGATGDGEGGTWWSRTEQEGCIIVASSDESVKFHEVWAGGTGTGARNGGNAHKKSAAMGLGAGLGTMNGVLGGSDILEGLCEGIDSAGRLGGGEVIR